MDLSPMLSGAERLLSVTYKEAALATDVLFKQVDGYIRNPGPSAAERKHLKGLRDRLCAHGAKAQMDLFSSSGPDAS